MKYKIEIEVTKEGYTIAAKKGGKTFLKCKDVYKGNGETERVEQEGEIDDHELEEILDDFDMAANNLMYYIMDGEEEME